MPTRRTFLGSGIAATVGLAGCASSDDGTDPPDTTTDAQPAASTATDTQPAASTTEPTTSRDGVRIGLDTVTDRTETPVAFAEGESGTRYVVDRPGTVYRLDGGATTVLDLTASVMTGRERGLLGLALHPDFASNGRLYLRYSSRPRSGTPSEYSHTFVLSEFQARADGTIDPGSERVVLEIPQPQGNHNSGSLAFGPDGCLYVGVGDGGASGDVGRGHVEDWYGKNEGGNGQDVTENLLGSLLRIDVDARTGSKAYGIPQDNPLVGREGLDEHYAWGLRNPWGISFDGEDLYVADVGQGRYEEVDRVTAGGNYGWNVREGAHCFGAEECPTVGERGERLLDPVIEYPHSGAAVSGVAVVGGHVYRGDAFPDLSGTYVFGDLLANGRLFGATPTGDGLWPTEVLRVEEASQDRLGSLLGIARDSENELYVLTRGSVHRLVPAG